VLAIGYWCGVAAGLGLADATLSFPALTWTVFTWTASSVSEEPGIRGVCSLNHTVGKPAAARSLGSVLALRLVGMAAERLR